MPIEGIRVSRSLAKTINRGGFSVTFDQAFRQVMLGCQNREETWISDEMIDLFEAAFLEGWVHSCEVWCDGELGGGVYGVAIGKVFSAESMFTKFSNMGKVALYSMVNRVAELGFELFDIQIINNHTQSLGAFEMSLADYHARLDDLRS